MSRYQVTWSRNVVAALARIWAVSRSRSMLAEAQDLVDRRLAADPHGAGREISEGLYRIVSPPLVAYYEVAAKEVLVVNAGATYRLDQT